MLTLSNSEARRIFLHRHRLSEAPQGGDDLDDAAMFRMDARLASYFSASRAQKAEGRVEERAAFTRQSTGRATSSSAQRHAAPQL